MPPKAAPRGEYIETETGNKISRRASILGPKHIILAGKCVIQHDVVVRGDLVRAASAKPPPPPTATTDPSAKAASTTAAPAAENVAINLGRYVFIAPHVTLHPPSRLSSSSSSSSSTTTTTTTTTTATQPSSSAAPPAAQQTHTYFPLRIADYVQIGAHTHVAAASIGAYVTIGAHCVVGNMCLIKDNVRVLDYTVLPPHSVWPSGCVVGGRPARVLGDVGEGWTAELSADAARERWAAAGNRAR